MVEKIEKRFGRPIRYSKDCEALSISIARACHERISATTLKRLFGFARKIEAPRRYTLDVLAIYAGYANWDAATRQHENREEIKDNKPGRNTAENEIILLHKSLADARANHTIYPEKIATLCQQFGHLPAIIPFITEIITIAEQLGQLGFIKQVFALPNIFDHGRHNEAQLYAIGSTMGFLLRRNLHWVAELIPVLAANPFAQQYLIEWFVDEDKLSEYYGMLLDMYHLHRGESTQDRLFYYALKYNQAVMESDLFALKHRFDQIRELNLDETIYCIPAARYAGIRLSEEKDKLVFPGSFFCRLMEKYVKQRPFPEAVAFTFFGCKQLFSGKRNDWLEYLTALFMDAYGKNKPVVTSQLGLKLENALWIYLAYGTFLKGDLPKSRILFSRTDPGLFPPILFQSLTRDMEMIKQHLPI
jgi:hypothetical protein